MVGMARGRVVVIGEVRWRSRPMGVDILGEVDRFKLPALRKAVSVATRPQIVLVSRSGFTDGLREAATADDRLRLIDLEELVQG